MHVAIICYSGGSRHLECYREDGNGKHHTLDNNTPIIGKTIDKRCANAIVDRMESLGLKRLSGIGYLIEYNLTDEKEIALFLLRHR